MNTNWKSYHMFLWDYSVFDSVIMYIYSHLNDEEKEKLERWTKISIDEIIKKDYSLDLGLIKDESLLDVETLPNPILNTNETIEKLEEAIDLLKSVVNELKNCGLSEED